jgi:hypothetical protein
MFWFRSGVLEAFPALDRAGVIGFIRTALFDVPQHVHFVNPSLFFRENKHSRSVQAPSWNVEGWGAGHPYSPAPGKKGSP